MNIAWLFITSVLSITSVFCHQNISQIRVFPALNQSIAGVIQVSYLNNLNQPHYAFNASEARRFCQSLGLNIASKAQVENALRRCFETCRFGWVDEHFAVIPRIHALAVCGQNQTGLVPWRASVTKKFDVFCFNESDAAEQLKDTAENSPESSSCHNLPPSKAADHPATAQPTSPFFSLSSITPSDENMIKEAKPARFVSSAHGSAGVKVVLIACTCGLLLISMIILAYLKLRRRCPKNSDKKQQQEYIQTEEWKCVKDVTESKKTVQEDQSVHAEDETS